MSADSRPEWLPEGWTMRVSRRVSGCIDRYYTSLASGYTCRSKVEVMRHLDKENIFGSLIKSTPCFQDNKQQIIERVENSQNTPEWLPSGWILEIKTRKSGIFSGKPYKCYIDPFTGARFYSKREVFRYLKSGMLRSHTINERLRIRRNSMKDICTSSSQNEIISKKFMDNPPIAARKRITRGTTARRCLFSGQANMKMVIEIDEFSEKPGMEAADSSCMTPSNVEHLGKMIETLPDAPSRGGVLYLQHVSVKPPLTDTRLYPPKREELDTVNENPPAMEAENVMHLQPGDEKLSLPKEMMNENPSQPAYRKPHRHAKRRRAAKKRGSRDPSGSQKQASGVRPGPKRTKAFKAITLPLRWSKRLAGIKADIVPPPGIRDLSCQSGGFCQRSTRFDELRSATVIDLELLSQLESKESSGEQAAPGEQGAYQLSNVGPEFPLILPFGDSWPDPCIEFAFKTLMGDIPELEDTAVIHDYLHQQLISAQSSSASLTFRGPENLSQPELHAQRTVHDGTMLSFEKGLHSRMEVNRDCRS